MPRIILFTVLLVLSPFVQAEDENTFSKNEVLQSAESFFGKGAEGLADVLEKVFKEQGRPNAVITGEEASAALGIGVRYGKGTLKFKSGSGRKVYWQGPSVGFDVGANASKAFVLVYHLPNEDALFQRYPGVEGTLYFVGGVGVNYVQSGKTILAPIRFGVGWRQGVNLGYMDFTREASLIPF